MARRLAHWPSDKHGSEEKVCPECGAVFFRNIHLSWEQWEKQTFCSGGCLGAAHKKRYLGRGLKLDKMKTALVRSFEQAGVAYGECQCGCGTKTRIAKQSSSREGTINGEPVRFVKGHATRTGSTSRPGRNRQMVEGLGFSDRRPGSIKHLVP